MVKNVFAFKHTQKDGASSLAIEWRRYPSVLPTDLRTNSIESLWGIGNQAFFEINIDDEPVASRIRRFVVRDLRRDNQFHDRPNQL